METPMPTRKVGAGGATGALTLIIVWVLNSFVLPPDRQITGEIAAAITTILSFAVSYLVPPAPVDKVVEVGRTVPTH